jgi:uncharacterized Zn-finger protein
MFAVYPYPSEARYLSRKKCRAAVETYDCKVCQRSFTKQYNLLIHERTHSKEDNYSLFNCNICGKAFKKAENMKNHRYYMTHGMATKWNLVGFRRFRR